MIKQSSITFREDQFREVLHRRVNIVPNVNLFTGKITDFTKQLKEPMETCLEIKICVAILSAFHISNTNWFSKNCIEHKSSP